MILTSDLARGIITPLKKILSYEKHSSSPRVLFGFNCVKGRRIMLDNPVCIAVYIIVGVCVLSYKLGCWLIKKGYL